MPKKNRSKINQKIELSEELLYQVALTRIPGVGDKSAKTLIAHCGGARAVFEENKAALQKVPGINSKGVKNIHEQAVLAEAEDEIRFLEKQAVTPLFYLDPGYPRRLKLCEDGPVMLYFKGNVDLNKRHVISMVGSRNATSYGLDFCEKFIHEIKAFNPLIVSGLAYGIDVQCHKQALHNGIPTVAVMGHGLDRVYPQVHTNIARDMQENGGLLTEFWSGTIPGRENFPKRNRVVAGMSDAVIVVEAARSGGALITAEIASSYNREVFAVPGRVGDSFSEGCNFLIKSNKAALINSVEDLKYILGWEAEDLKQPRQIQLFDELEGLEKQVWESLHAAGGKMELQTLCLKLSLPSSKALQTLMGLELRGFVKSRPGQVYALSR